MGLIFPTRNALFVPRLLRNVQARQMALTHEALADVDAGRVIDHQAVQVWADSLVPTNRCPCSVEGTEMDQQGAFCPIGTKIASNTDRPCRPSHFLKVRLSV